MMRPHSRCIALLGAVLIGASLTVPCAALEQAAEAPTVANGPGGMAMQEWQGVSCLYGGVIGGLGVFYYSDVLAVAVTCGTNPLLLVPMIAAGFLGGCTVGANSAPGLVWIARHL